MHFYLRMDTTASSFYFCIFSSVASPPLFPLVFRVWEGPDWVCFGDAHPFLLSRGHQIHTAEPLVSVFHVVPPRRWLTRGQSSVADSIAKSDNDERCKEGDYSRSVR